MERVPFLSPLSAYSSLGIRLSADVEASVLCRIIFNVFYNIAIAVRLELRYPTVAEWTLLYKDDFRSSAHGF